MTVNFKEDFHGIKFKCRRCSHCCQNSNIRLSPFDILRLCKRLGISTSEFHEKFSYFILDKENQDLLTCRLKTFPECVFLGKEGEKGKEGKEGCRVYEERPFGCRIYPLAYQPFFDGRTFENKLYVLEECPGFNSGKKMKIKEFKESQGVDVLESVQEAWVKFKIKAINSKIMDKKGYNLKFFNICYNFDGDSFKRILNELKMEKPENVEEKYKIIMELANKLLL